MFRVRSGPIERGVVKVPNDLLFYSTSGHGGNNMTYYCRTMRSRGELELVAIVLCLIMWSGPWLCLTLYCVMEDNLTPSKYPREVAFQRSFLAQGDCGQRMMRAYLDWLCFHMWVLWQCNVGMSLALLYECNFTHRAWIPDSNIIYHLQATPPNYGSWIMYSIFDGFSIAYIHITLFNDVVPHNMTVRCWEFNMNTSLLAHLFTHSIVILWGPTDGELNVE